jgi:hypothetical protein
MLAQAGIVSSIYMRQTDLRVPWSTLVVAMLERIAPPAYFSVSLNQFMLTQA